MAQNDILKFWILNTDKKPLYENLSGHIETGAGVTKTDLTTPANLRYSPDGWLDTLVKWGRNNKYLGLFREYSPSSITFVRDGAKILRDAMWKKGMEAVLYLAISKLDLYNFPDKYDPWYAGELDFSKFRQDENGVSISIMEGGLSKLLKAYESTTYEIPINTDPERFGMYMDGLTFENKVEWVIYGDQVIGFPGGLFGAGTISQEGTTQGVVVHDQELYPPVIFGTSILPEAADKWLSSVVNKSITQHYEINIKFKAFSGTTTRISLIKIGKGDVITEYSFDNQLYAATQDVSITKTFAIPMVDGDKLYLQQYLFTGLGQQITILGGSIKLNYDVRFDPSLCECISWFTLFERLTEKLTGGKFGCKSSFLQSLTGTQAVTSGQAIRKFQSESVIKTSMNDFFKACQRWGVGLGIENNQLVIEKHEYFFQSDTALHLGEVSDVEWYVAEDLQINTIKVGYANQEYDNVNGRDEFNVTQQYTTPHTRIVREHDLICPYRGDMTGAELTRLKLYGQDSTDNKADNDTFIFDGIKGTDYDYYRGVFETQINTGSYYIQLPTVLFQLPNGTVIEFNGNSYTVLNTSYLIAGYTLIQVAEAVTNGNFTGSVSTYDANVYRLNRPNWTAITGLNRPSEAFNINLSPKESLLNNGAYLRSLLDFQDANKIVFTSGEKNSLLSRTLAGRTVTENADWVIANLPSRLFRPYYAKMKTKVPMNLPAIMREKPYQKISWAENGVEFKGYLWSGGIAPADMDSQEFVLLSAPENDLTKLI